MAVLISLSELKIYAGEGVDRQLIHDHIKAASQLNQSEPAKGQSLKNLERMAKYATVKASSFFFLRVVRFGRFAILLDLRLGQ